jgi:APA family basic amino acid/polyamine antiporter
LTLEYGVSSAAVARTWGDKLVDWVHHLGYDLWQPQGEGWGGVAKVNIYAGILQLLCVLVMLRGLNVSKLTVDVFTVAKMLLVAFMTVGGFVLYNKDNMRPFSPSGFTGVFRGSMNIFFGYLGYDEVCCLGAETKDPHRNVRHRTRQPPAAVPPHFHAHLTHSPPFSPTRSPWQSWAPSAA